LGVRRRLTETPVGRLATVTREGRPHIVPCCFVLRADVIYSAVDGKPKTTPMLQRVRNIEASAHASLLIDHYDDDWSTLWWIRVDGTARVVTEAAERDTAVLDLTAKYRQYEEQPPPGPVLAIDVARWRAWP
jgi:PPOX class probable F420-dependent enzyme